MYATARSPPAAAALFPACKDARASAPATVLLGGDPGMPVLAGLAALAMVRGELIGRDRRLLGVTADRTAAPEPGAMPFS